MHSVARDEPILATPQTGRVRLRIKVRGIVQGLGFRPYIYKLSTARNLDGFVLNTSWGVLIELQGSSDQCHEFVLKLERSPPPHCEIWGLEIENIPPRCESGFSIVSSISQKGQVTPVIPDLAVCDECLTEISDPDNRRYRYPFTSCTQCGPRYSISTRLPYDRDHTSMIDFSMCQTCQSEYDNPADRRFHAETNACVECGPILTLTGKEGREIAKGDLALTKAIDSIKSGKIIAMKGLGGFQLLVDARSERAVLELRKRKQREHKPFALMFKSLDDVKQACYLSHQESMLLTGSEMPIVILRRRPGWSGVVDNIAPGNPYLGVMLPYTPLHNLLMHDLEFPIVATSGNISQDPIITDNNRAVIELGNIADEFLTHNRKIVRSLDDSVVQEVCGNQQVLRLARGYAPLTVKTVNIDAGILAMGGHLKTSLAATGIDRTVLGQHIGDLSSHAACNGYKHAVKDMTDTLMSVPPSQFNCDLHPDYESTRMAMEWSKKSGLPLNKVQHHVAHVAAGMAEHGLQAPLLGVAFDGTGYGTDGTIWGGEFIHVKSGIWSRVARFRHFCLPGGHAAIREPSRTALGLLYELFGKDVASNMPFLTDSFNLKQRQVLLNMCEKRINSPLTSSVGRLFDAISSILGLCHYNGYEGQAACELEWAALKGDDSRDYEFIISQGPQGSPCRVVDWEPVILKLIEDHLNAVSVADIAASFHAALARVIVELARQIDCDKVLLTGGCFQNRTLTTMAVGLLGSLSIPVFWHHKVPPGDGGIALGQAVSTSWQRQQGYEICV